MSQVAKVWRILMDRKAVPGPRNLQTLLAGFVSELPPDMDITDLTLDSRQVRSGGAFLALQGMRTHGIGFAAQVVNAGATAILCEPVPNLAMPRLPAPVALVTIPGLSSLVGTIADRFFGSPSQSVSIAGVTGTNGKTTTAYLIAAALAELGKSASYAGTLGFGRVNALRGSAHTTPDAVTVHRQIAELRDAEIGFLGMEVSSHALDQQRVEAVRFDTAVFTNLTRDHLDYHGTLEAYGAAKAKLFTWPGLKHAVINVDDAFGLELAAMQRAQTLTMYSRAAKPIFPAMSGARALIASRVTAAPHGLQIAIDGTWGRATLNSRFVGDFNVENLLAVLGVLLGWDFSLAQAVSALERCVAPPGRMETFSAPHKPLIIVDYAHTPDALEKALHAARKHCTGRLTCVFGCGGDRDAGKRPMMGSVAQRLADALVITDDNPRTEDGDAIVADIVSGLSSPQRALVVRDRAAAIELAIRSATADDVVLIAGKGHEDYQIVGADKRHFSDREVACAALRRAP